MRVQSSVRRTNVARCSTGASTSRRATGARQETRCRADPRRPARGARSSPRRARARRTGKSSGRFELRATGSSTRPPSADPLGRSRRRRRSSPPPAGRHPTASPSRRRRSAIDTTLRGLRCRRRRQSSGSVTGRQRPLRREPARLRGEEFRPLENPGRLAATSDDSQAIGSQVPGVAASSASQRTDVRAPGRPTVLTPRSPRRRECAGARTSRESPVDLERTADRRGPLPHVLQAAARGPRLGDAAPVVGDLDVNAATAGERSSRPSAP